MPNLPTLIPDVDYLLSLETEELASFLLISLSPLHNRGQVHVQELTAYVVKPFPHAPGYNDPRTDEISLAITEAWNWLEVQGLLVPAPGINGSNGFRLFSRRARKMASLDDVKCSLASDREGQIASKNRADSLVGLYARGIRRGGVSGDEGGRSARA